MSTPEAVTERIRAWVDADFIRPMEDFQEGTSAKRDPTKPVQTNRTAAVGITGEAMTAMRRIASSSR